MLSKKLWFDYSDKCKSFAAFLYYVHIIGDHMGTDYANVALDLQMIPLANRNEANIIDELEDTFAVLFDDQTTSVYYKHLLDSMKDIKKRAIKVFHSTGGLNTEEKYLEYQKCAEDLMDLLIEDIPPLLKNEEFFSKVFYSTQ